MQRPTTGIPNGYRGPLSASNIHEGLAPHALFNHQAASKKSFRIRPQKEQELLKNQQSLSSKDIGTDFNNDMLKSVYELRKSHAALVNRPISSQPFN